MTTSIPFIDLQAQRRRLGEPLDQAILAAVAGGQWVMGPQVAELEAKLAAFAGVKHCIACANGTDALMIVLRAWNIGPGDAVFVPAFTFAASAEVVALVGASPVFVDVQDDTFNMDPALTAAAVTPATRAVVPVHLFGLCADMTAIGTAVGPSIAVVEDAACAAGASYHGRPAGGLGSAACFSFHPRKSITTGEGGMLVTADADLAGRAEQLRNHGAAVPEEVRHHGPAPFLLPDFDELGFNYRMTDLQAAIGLVQLSKLDAFVDERAQWAKWYSDELASLGWLRLPEEPEGGRHAWQAYVTVVDEDAPIARNDLMARLHELGVATRPGTHSVPSTGYYRRRLDVETDSYPVATRLQEQSMAIPLHNRMTHDDYEYVVSAIRATVGAR